MRKRPISKWLLANQNSGLGSRDKKDAKPLIKIDQLTPGLRTDEMIGAEVRSSDDKISTRCATSSSARKMEGTTRLSLRADFSPPARTVSWCRSDLLRLRRIDRASSFPFRKKS